MTVLINGARTEVEPGTSIARLVRAIGSEESAVAVALNEEVVVRSRWESTPVREGDRIELLGAAQGG